MKRNRIPLQEWRSSNIFRAEMDYYPGIEKYLKPIYSREGLRFKALNYVGILPINENTTIVINPKAKINDFLYILGKSRTTTGNIPNANLAQIQAVSNTEKVSQCDNLFDFIVVSFLEMLDELRRYGLLKLSERKIMHNKVRGRVLIEPTLAKWIRGDQTGIVCNGVQTTDDNRENRIVKLALYSLLYLSEGKIGSNLRASLISKYRWFKDITLSWDSNSVADVREKIERNKVPSTRYYYYDILEMALFIIGNTQIELESFGKIRISSFLVDMNDVFERYIYYLIRDSVISKKYGVRFQESKYLFESSQRYMIRPDLVIYYEEIPVMVMDMKYKESLTRPDINQAITYVQKYDVDTIALIFPSWQEGLQIQSEKFHGKEIVEYGFDMRNIKESENSLLSFIQEIL